MVAGALAGLFAAFGLTTGSVLDRRAELYLSVIIWVGCLVGALLGGLLGRGFVLGALVVMACWSVLHFPRVRTLETDVPRTFPLFAFSASALAIIMMLLVGLFS
jgi:hypothetical protein